MRTIGIGMLGCGTVGTGVLRILAAHRETLRRRLGADLVVRSICVRALAKPRDPVVDRGLLTADPRAILDDPDLRVVIELVGGTSEARAWVLDALRAGKHVITANKALLAIHGPEIFDAARRHRAMVYFEGAVAGGIPVLRTIREGLAGDEITRVIGIVNGTSNFVLDTMTRTGAAYADVLGQAQRAGLAEADPSLDVGGGDAAHKLAILALLSFGLRVDPTEIPTEGITALRPFEFEQAARHDYAIRSLAIAELRGPGRVRLRVHPALVPRTHLFAGVGGANNAVMVDSLALGRSLYFGAGAGMMPTGSAVVSDLVEVARDILGFGAGGPPPEAFPAPELVRPEPLDELVSANYLCVHVPNVAGALGRVASTLGRHGVGIERMHQDTPGRGEPMNMVVFTEPTPERRLTAALAELDGSADCWAPALRLRIFDDPER